MPLHDYSCGKCKVFFEAFCPVAALQEPVLHSCGEVATRRFLHAPRVQGDITPYDCPVTGKWIESRSEHRNNLKKHGAHVLEPGEVEQDRKARQRRDEDIEKAADTAVERAAAQLFGA